MNKKILHKYKYWIEYISNYWILLQSACHNHVYIHSFRSIIKATGYRKVSRGWGHLITWNVPMMGHLNSISASGGGNLNKNFAKSTKARGLPGGVCWSFDLTGTLFIPVTLLQYTWSYMKYTSPGMYECFRSSEIMEMASWCWRVKASCKVKVVLRRCSV